MWERAKRSEIWNLGIEAPKIWNQGIEAQKIWNQGIEVTKSVIWDMATPDSTPIIREWSSIQCTEFRGGGHDTVH